ncbi:flagellar assembly lytic transglycosylase [Marispirochaeta aestuarii]|uniref:flagellar assembly lytic transglycosylase n=1 Tax=Marispirochaeta aestuarii TaxID=1963862 RepID=UPI00117895F6|nr:lytic transglycosylase domain-containing protein [Marispirochaeta aestuarii]
MIPAISSVKKVPLPLFSLLIPLFMLCISCCGSPTIWGYPEQDFRSRLVSGTLPQLHEEDISRLSFSELNQLGPGAPLFLSYFPFADAGAPLRLRLYQAELGEEPYASFALELLIRDLLASEDYRLIQDLEDEIPPRYHEFYPWRRSRVSAAYWLRQDEEAAEMLDELVRDFPEQVEADRELVLMKTVLEQRTGREDWRNSFVSFFRDFPAGPHHVRAWDYLRIEGLLDGFGPEEQRLLRGVDLVARGEKVRGFELLQGLFDGARTEEFLSSGTLQTIAMAADTPGRTGEVLELYGRISEELPGFSREIRELSAFLLRRIGRHREAHTLFKSLVQEGDQRFLWYAFSSLVRSDTAAALGELPFLVSEMEEPSYFSDVLAELCQRMARYRNWTGIVRAYRILDGSVAAGVLSPYAYISARAAMTGLSDLPMDLPPADILQRLGRGEYPGSGGDVAPEGSSDSYYRLLAAVLSAYNPEPESRPSVPEVEAGRLDPLVLGLLSFGLTDEALEITNNGDSGTSSSAAAAVVEALYGEDRYEEGLRLLLRRAIPMEERFFYPRAFEKETENLAEEQAVPAWLLFSLVRQESLFNPAALSHAGAVGLTQLMPSTAGDAARRLGMESPGDLSDPEVNLRLGAWYLGHMMERTDSLADALAAYNAGITRLRRWRRQAGGLPDDLFIETIPFEETRDYVKRLLVSSWNYGYLYYRLGGNELVSRYFPRL